LKPTSQRKTRNQNKNKKISARYTRTPKSVSGNRRDSGFIILEDFNDDLGFHRELEEC
jgi:hypothetical protein